MAIDSKKMRETLKKIVKPVELAELEREGLITKVGAWYRVKNWNLLPEHVTAKVTQIEQDSKGIKVKFIKVSKSIKKLAEDFR